jgi:hypothetical protein
MNYLQKFLLCDYILQFTYFNWNVTLHDIFLVVAPEKLNATTGYYIFDIYN